MYNVKRLLSSPSESNWLKACDDPGFSSLDQGSVDQLLPVVEQWPDDIVRRAPEELTEQAAKGTYPPALRLCNELQLMYKFVWQSDPDGLALAFATAFRDEPALAGITRLWLFSSRVTEEALTHIVADNRLTFLSLEESTPGGDALVPLVQSEGLRRLNLSSCGLTAELLAQLSGSGIFANLESLTLSRNQLGDAPLAEMIQAAGLTSLQELDLSEAGAGPQTVHALASSGSTGLRVVNLMQGSIDSGSISALVSSAAAQSFETLYLHDNAIDDDGAEAIATSKNLGRLAYLGLDGNPISEQAAEEIRTSKLLPQLVWFDAHDALAARLDHLLEGAATRESFLAALDLLRKATNLGANTDPLLETCIPAFEALPPRHRSGDAQTAADLVTGALPLGIVALLSAIDFGPMLVDAADRRALVAWLKEYPEDGPAIEGVRWRVPQGETIPNLETFSEREPILASPLFRHLRVFDASQSHAFVSVFDHPAKMSTVGDDRALGFSLPEVLGCSDSLEVINLFAAPDDHCLPREWRSGSHPARDTLKALDLGGGPPLSAQVARELLEDSAVEFLACRAGGCAAQWTGVDEEPYTPPEPWDEEILSTLNEQAEVIYGHVNSCSTYEPYPRTDWATWFDLSSAELSGPDNA
jgi:hypothetical protein